MFFTIKLVPDSVFPRKFCFASQCRPLEFIGRPKCKFLANFFFKIEMHSLHLIIYRILILNFFLNWSSFEQQNISFWPTQFFIEMCISLHFYHMYGSILKCIFFICSISYIILFLVCLSYYAFFTLILDFKHMFEIQKFSKYIFFFKIDLTFKAFITNS